MTVLRQAGASRERILVLVDGQYQQVIDLLNLLQVSIIVIITALVVVVVITGERRMK